jgi:hypothetical protein
MQYRVSSDAKGNPLEGGKNYKFHLPPNVPASNFWSILVYDKKTGLIIKTDQSWPSVHSQCKNLVVNQDGSVDAWFGPTVPPGREGNWIRTVPGQHWNMILRLYYPLESWLDERWRPGEIEEVM